MSLEQQILSELQIIKRQLAKLEKEQSKKTWVKASVIRDLTGWDKKGMEKARLQGLVAWKKENGFWYHLESIHPSFLKKQLS